MSKRVVLASQLGFELVDNGLLHNARGALVDPALELAHPVVFTVDLADKAHHFVSHAFNLDVGLREFPSHL